MADKADPTMAKIQNIWDIIQQHSQNNFVTVPLSFVFQAITGTRPCEHVKYDFIICIAYDVFVNRGEVKVRLFII